jgi:hypothetical protein
MAWEESSHTGHAIRQMQNQTQVVVSGAAANTNIAVTGAKVGDHVTVVAFTAGVPAIPTGAKVTSAGNIQCTSSTAGATLVVTLYPRSK